MTGPRRLRPVKVRADHLTLVDIIHNRAIRHGEIRDDAADPQRIVLPANLSTVERLRQVGDDVEVRGHAIGGRRQPVDFDTTQGNLVRVLRPAVAR